METEKRRFGDRRDGKLLRDIDPMHYFMPLLYPNRCDNEAFISETIDLTSLNQWLEEKNKTIADFPYKMFHIIVAAVIKTLTLRPKLNRFIVNGNTYMHNDVSAAFVIKKQFSDKGEEGLALLHSDGSETLTDIYNYIKKQVTECRSGKADSSSESMDIVGKLPRFVSKTVAKVTCLLDKHGWVPKAFVASDPFYSSVVLSNIGSLKMKCGYHHLVNWGTTSVFCVIGEKKISPIFNDDGTYVMHETVELGLTIDERVADGYYYSKSVRLLKKLLENPGLLEKPMKEEIEY